MIKSGARLPNNIQTPNNTTIIPRYMGFLENRKGPFNTSLIGCSKGLTGVSARLNVPAPQALNDTPDMTSIRPR